MRLPTPLKYTVMALCLFGAGGAYAKNIAGETVVLQGLDKVTARINTFSVPVGKNYRYGALDIQVSACERTPPEEPPESVAFLKITDVVDGENPQDYFSGWMYASSPALNSLEHPVYDVWVTDCIPGVDKKPVVVVVPQPKVNTVKINTPTAEPKQAPQGKTPDGLAPLQLDVGDLPAQPNVDSDADSERSDSQLLPLNTGGQGDPNPAIKSQDTP